MDLNVFFLVPFAVEPMLPKQTTIEVHLMVILTIGTLEYVWIWFAFFSFKAWWVCFFVGFVTPTELIMILIFMWAIKFDTFESLDSTR